ncbi:ABC transporter permease [Alterisphingorhabdus coralli]|uniref:ABC transporter permease n=1 Tax=Alterisphingorhabdus coralli TaxID=3071408 RepID=A0AA97F695_9SPHN|nr:ABC transporter permease [Parasphingorhabdus sp. SCSIO 66989]WOE74716.1 ABC transporter permease [Parasphingorhabdus sp. SCSIO 66989]
MGGRIWHLLSDWMVNIAIAMTALRTNLMRSILTMLGVMIGVFAVTLAVAVGAGAQVSVMQSINALGSNMAIVIPEPETSGPRRSFDRGRLTMRDARAIQKQVPGVEFIAPQLRSTVQMTVAGTNTSTNAIGTTMRYAEITNSGVQSGRFLDEADQRSAARVVVLGTTVAQELFGDFDPVGQTVRINRIPFSVIGLLESKGSTFGNDNDDTAVIPIATMRQRFVGDTLSGPDDLNLLFVGFSDATSLVQSKEEITRILRERYRVEEDALSPFTVRTTEEFLRETETVTSIFQIVLVAIASISLLVGGIGIMNIMLVSVTERTREIGLRMALGARRSDIRNQFLVEAAVLCVLGGTVGLILAWISGIALAAYADFPVPIGIGVAIGAILFSALIGLLFGGYPAIRASRLSPIEALRSE